MSKIAFVSFKGGAGRSVSLANIAFQTAMGGRRVGCIDADLESGGLHTIFNVQAPFDEIESPADRKSKSFPVQVYLMQERFRNEVLQANNVEADFANDSPGVVSRHFALDLSQAARNRPFRDTLKKVKGAGLLVIPASPNPGFTNRVDTRGDLYNHFFNLLDAFESGCKLDTIFIDSRAGISNLGLPAIAFADATVICLRWGKQHQDGTVRFIQWYSDWLKRGDVKTKLYLLVSQMDENDLTKAVAEYLANNSLTSFIQRSFIVPHVADLSTDDRIVFGTATTLPERAYVDALSAISRQLREDLADAR